MARERAFDVAKEGFRLIRRRPAAVFVWGLLLTIVQNAIPTAFAIWLFASPDSVLRRAMANEGGLDASALQAFEMQVNLMQLATVPFAVVVATVISAAIIRSVLQPEERSYFSLRVGAAEGWMLLVSAVMMVVIVIVAVPVVLVIVIACVIAGAASKTAAIVLGVLLSAIALAAYFWLASRFMLAMPLTFVARKFRLFESWALTKGHAGWIVRVWLTMFLLMIGLMIATFLVMIVLAVPAMFALVPLFQAVGDTDPLAWATQHMGVIIGWGTAFLVASIALSSAWTGAVMAIAGAPFARIALILGVGGERGQAPGEDVLPG